VCNIGCCWKKQFWPSSTICTVFDGKHCALQKLPSNANLIFSNLKKN
jgi:hypothetical protein